MRRSFVRRMRLFEKTLLKKTVEMVCKLFFCVCAICFVQDDAQTKRDKKEAASAFDAYLSNITAWEKGDYLLKVTESFDSFDDKEDGKGLIIETKRFYRFVFDHKKKLYLYIESMERKSTTFENNEPPVLRQTAAFVVDKHGNSFARVFPKGVAKLKKFSPNELFRQFKVRDLRCIGANSFGGHSDYATAKRALLQFASGGTMVKTGKLSSTSLQTVFSRTDSKDENFELQVTFNFDMNRFVPTKCNLDGIEKSPKLRKGWISKERYSWKEINGIYVPTEIHRETMSSRKVNGKKYMAVQYVDAKTHWFGLNEKIDETLFNADILKDANKMMRLVDPKRSKAKSIVGK